MSDNGPPLNSNEFQQFATNIDIENVTSSPYYPQSNGKVENAIKTAKSFLKKSKAARSDIYLALLEWSAEFSSTKDVWAPNSNTDTNYQWTIEAQNSGRYLRKSLQEETAASKTLQYQC